MSEEISSSHFYYPLCKEIGCNGILKIKINSDFSVDCECDKDEKHKKKKLYYKTFERFYLQNKSFEKCSKCKCNLDCDRYICNKCYASYCCYCFISDEHIKNDINNLSITNNKCLIHKKELNQYCITCKRNLCFYCLKDDIEYN